MRVTDGLLSVLRVRPFLGDLLRKEDDVPGAPNRVLLTYGYWQRAFGASRDIVGQSIVIDGSPYEIAGVLPASFTFLNTRAAVLLPLKPDRTRAVTGPGFGNRGVARLKPGVTLAEANDDIARRIPLIPEQFPLQPGLPREMWDGVGLAPNVLPFSEDVIGDVGRSLWILLAPLALFSSWRGPTSRTCCSCAPRDASRSLRSARHSARAAAALLRRCCRRP